MLFKRLISTIILIAFILFPAACSSKPQPNSITELTYWTSNPAFESYHLKKAEEWNTLYPDRQIALKTKLFDNSQIQDVLWTTLHSGILISGYEPPDMVDLRYDEFDVFVSSRNALLYPLLEKSEIDDRQYEAFTYRGLIFGIPYGIDKMVMYFNQPLLEQAGIDINNIQTWSDVELQGKHYFEKTNKPFIGIDAEQYDLFLTCLTQTDIDFTNTTLGLKSEKSKDVIEYLTRLVRTNTAILLPGGSSESNPFYRAFQNGEIAVYIDQLSSAHRLYEKMPDLAGQVGIAEIPKNQNNALEAGSEIWIPSYATAVTMRCEPYNLLKDFLVFARLSDSANKEMLAQTGLGFEYHTIDVKTYAAEAEFRSYFTTPIEAFYPDPMSARRYLPNLMTMNEWLEGYEETLVRGILE